MKEKKYYALKAGIFLILISLAIELIDYFISFIACSGRKDGVFCVFPTHMVSFPLQIFGIHFGNLLVEDIVSLLIWFFLGALLGIIYQHIKKGRS